MANAPEVAQLQCEEETKGLLKAACFIAENELANSDLGHLVKFMKERSVFLSKSFQKERDKVRPIVYLQSGIV